MQRADEPRAISAGQGHLPSSQPLMPHPLLWVPPNFLPFWNLATTHPQNPLPQEVLGGAGTPRGGEWGPVRGHSLGRERGRHTHPAPRFLLIRQKPAF